MKREAEANAESDRKEKERVDKINSADAMIFQTEKQIKEYSDKLTEDNKNKLNECLSNLKDAHKSSDLEKIDESMNKLTETWNLISTELYKTDSENKETKENVEDVSFEEVK